MVNLVGKVRFRVLSGRQISLLFIGKGFVTFHPEFSVQFYSFAKSLFHFIGSLFRQGSDRLKSFLLLANDFVVGKMYSRWVWYLFSSQSIGVPKVRPTMRAADGGYAARFFERFRGFELFPFRRRVHPPTHRS